MSLRPSRTQITSAAPRRLGRYILYRELAAGGMGRVFLASAEGPRGFEKVVAVKVMHDHLIRDPVRADMFLDEARIASGMTHPNICSVFDFGEHEGVYYLVMEYLVGRSAHQVFDALPEHADLRDNPLFYPLMALVVAQACEGLQAVHTLTDSQGQPRNVVHRDVSPENIFITFDGSVQLTDFGIAQATQRARASDPGTFKGKMAYAAPEQYGDEEVDARADVWAAGVVLWELITGRTLFHRSSDARMLNAVLTENIPRPSEMNPDVPPTLEEIAMNALERDVDVRYQSARLMAQDLHRFTAQRGVHVGMAELSDWMRHLFPQGIRQSQEVISEAKGIDSRVLRQAGVLDQGLNLQLSQELLMPENRGRGRPAEWDASTSVSGPDGQSSMPSLDELHRKPTVVQGHSRAAKPRVQRVGNGWEDAGPTVVDEGMEAQMERASFDPAPSEKPATKEEEEREPVFTLTTFILLLILILTAAFVFWQSRHLEAGSSLNPAAILHQGE